MVHLQLTCNCKHNKFCAPRSVGKTRTSRFVHSLLTAAPDSNHCKWLVVQPQCKLNYQGWTSQVRVAQRSWLNCEEHSMFVIFINNYTSNPVFCEFLSKGSLRNQWKQHVLLNSKMQNNLLQIMLTFMSSFVCLEILSEILGWTCTLGRQSIRLDGCFSDLISRFTISLAFD